MDRTASDLNSALSTGRTTRRGRVKSNPPRQAQGSTRESLCLSPGITTIKTWRTVSHPSEAIRNLFTWHTHPLKLSSQVNLVELVQELKLSHKKAPEADVSYTFLSTSTMLLMSSGALPWCCNRALPTLLCRAASLSFLK